MMHQRSIQQGPSAMPVVTSDVTQRLSVTFPTSRGHCYPFGATPRAGGVGSRSMRRATSYPK